MPKSTASNNAYLALILNGTTFDGIAENDTTSPNTSLYLALHTSDPGVGGTQSTNETAYTNYVRIPVLRTTGGFTAPASSTSSNAALLQFAQCGVTGATVTHVSLGLLPSGAGQILYSGPLNSSLAVANLIQPQFSIGALDITEA